MRNILLVILGIVIGGVAVYFAQNQNIKANDGQSVAVAVQKQSPTQPQEQLTENLQKYYNFSDVFSKLKEMSSDGDLPKDCLNDSYCGEMDEPYGYQVVKQIADSCRKIIDARNTVYDDYRRPEPGDTAAIIEKYELLLNVARCQSYLGGYENAIYSDYIIRAQNNLPPPLVCLVNAQPVFKMDEKFITIAESAGAAEKAFDAIIFDIYRQNGNLCDPESLNFDG